MSNILITGMTASHVSPSTMKRTTTFASLLLQALKRAGHGVVVAEPSVHWRKDDFQAYDTILVGIAPITGLGANRAYGALSMIEQFWGDPRLRFFLDAPNPEQITAALSSIVKTPENITKPFYDYRKEYEWAVDPAIRARLLTAVDKLAEDDWPITVFPALPWDAVGPEGLLPHAAMGKVHGVNLDSILLDRPAYKKFSGTERWTADDVKSEWTTSLGKTLEHPIDPLRRSKWSDDKEVEFNMANSIGVILAPGKKKATWWSNRYAQALAVGVPVITEWRESSVLGEDWAMLASQIEGISDDRRYAIAENQKQQYLAVVGDVQTATTRLSTTLGI